jgi:hypothetical protein
MADHSLVAPVVPLTGPGQSSRRRVRLLLRAPKSGFLSVSLEIRDMIYKLLLTTAHCTDVHPTRRIVKLRLHTAILFVNKQISAESARVLRDENHFIIFSIHTIDPTQTLLLEIPKFRWLPDDKLKNPLLRVVVDAADETIRGEQTHTCITTPDGLQSIIGTIWGIARYQCPSIDIGRKFHHADLKVSLEFSLKVLAR